MIDCLSLYVIVFLGPTCTTLHLTKYWFVSEAKDKKAKPAEAQCGNQEFGSPRIRNRRVSFFAFKDAGRR